MEPHNGFFALCAHCARCFSKLSINTGTEYNMFHTQGLGFRVQGSGFQYILVSHTGTVTGFRV